MTYYEILEISEKASQEVIRMAYKALCKKYHPDVYPGDKSFAEEQIKKLNEAYAVLSDVYKKKEYDDSLKSEKSYRQNSYSEPKQESSSSSINNLIRRGFMALEDSEWLRADNFFEQVLNQDVEVAEAYLGKLMIDLKVTTRSKLKDYPLPFDKLNNYKRALIYADDTLKGFLVSTAQYIKDRNYETDRRNIYNKACDHMQKDYSLNDLKIAIKYFNKILNYKDSSIKIKECEEKIRILEEDDKLNTKVTIIAAISFLVVIGMFVLFCSINLLKMH